MGRISARVAKHHNLSRDDRVTMMDHSQIALDYCAASTFLLHSSTNMLLSGWCIQRLQLRLLHTPNRPAACSCNASVSRPLAACFLIFVEDPPDDLRTYRTPFHILSFALAAAPTSVAGCRSRSSIQYGHAVVNGTLCKKGFSRPKPRFLA